MTIKKTSDLLYRSTQKKVRFVEGLSVNTKGPAGIMSPFHPASAAGMGVKCSTLALIMDKIFMDNSVMARQAKVSESVYVRFEHDEKRYEAVYDGDKITWVGPEPSGYPVLIPVMIYVISDLYKGEGADELKEYFRDIKEKRDKESVLMFCDAFYYAYAKSEEHANISSYPNEISAEIIRRGLEKGTFTELEIMSGLERSEMSAPAAKEAVVEEKPEENYLVEYDGWTEEQKKNIPSPKVLDTFVMTNTATSIARKVKYRMNKVLARMNAGKEGAEAIGPDYINILMVGRPATGKTTVATAVAAMTGMPIYTVPFSKHTEEDTAEGKNKVVEGKIGFVETDFLKAFEHGGIIVCEEINLADPGVVMGSLGQAIEKPFIIMKDGYKPVKRHPLCIVIGTMNTGTAGSRQLNQALSSRFKCTYILDDPDKKTFINILAAQGYKKRACQFVYDAYDKIIKFLKNPQQSQEELCDNITLRGCFGALECMEEGESPKEALTNSLIGKIAEVDLEAARQVQDAVIKDLPDRV